MILTEKRRINHIPVLHVIKQKQFSDKTPLVFFLHGFTSTKERNMHYAYLLAEKGFRVIMPDAKYHGERTEGLTEPELALRFWEIVMSSIVEIELLKNTLVEQGLADSDQIGVAGTSMGGITTLAALSKYDWIHSAVSLMGTPSIEQFALWQLEQMGNNNIKMDIPTSEINRLMIELKKIDLSLQPGKLNKRPLLFWHGKLDPVVPHDHAYHFYQQNKKSYEGSEEKFEFVLDEQAVHNVTNEGVNRTVDWFEKYLGKGPHWATEAYRSKGFDL